MEKDRLRLAMLARRKQLDIGQWRSLSSSVQQNLVQVPCFQQAQSLALYSQINNEVQTADLLSAALQAGKQVYYPRVAGERLQFCRVLSAADLSPGAFGIAEPPFRADSLAGQLDLILVPGVAFDRAGYRLGYGKGFYDRELAQVSPATCRVGLCFEFQLCAELPYESHDQPVNLVVTEKQIITCH